ncbi:hypothetical protein DFH27DRAFT_556619 [Peziza echinospora]|nr:hypothetical protein DFH27DRAFT_556619 [Peziza echinospora]
MIFIAFIVSSFFLWLSYNMVFLIIWSFFRFEFFVALLFYYLAILLYILFPSFSFPFNPPFFLFFFSFFLSLNGDGFFFVYVFLFFCGFCSPILLHT